MALATPTVSMCIELYFDEHLIFLPYICHQEDI